MEEDWGAEVPTQRGSAEERFRALYEAHAEKVFVYCLSRLGPGGTTPEDLTAEIFAVVWRRMDVVPSAPDDRAYLYRIAYRQVKNQRRGEWRRRRRQRRLYTERPAAEMGDGGPTTPADVISDRVRAAIAQVPSAQREALLLVLWDGLTHAEAAEVLGCSANAVALRIHKARKHLVALLAREPAPSPNTDQFIPSWTQRGVDL